MKPKKQYLTLTPIIHDVIKGENLAYTEFKHTWSYYSVINILGHKCGIKCGEYIHFEFVNQN